jgi:uncharacterized protein (TIRG00374 family)
MRAPMRGLKVALLLLGAGLVALLVERVGWQPIAETLAQLAWWQLLVVCLPYALVTAVNTVGWRLAFPRGSAPFHRLLGARLAGEALNRLTALGSMGGEPVKVWLLRGDVAHADSVPSVVIAKTTITIAQALFLLLGVAVAWTMAAPESRVIRFMLWMLVVEAVAVAGFVGVQMAGLVGRAGRLLRWAGVLARVDYAQRLDESLREYYRRDRRRLALATGVYLGGWLLGAVETYLILGFLGLPVSLATAIVIETLGAGVRFATFFVPASLGPFESANAAAFEALGLGAGAGLAFSFVRRARQLIWGVVGLAVLAAMSWATRRVERQGTVSTATSSSTSA